MQREHLITLLTFQYFQILLTRSFLLKSGIEDCLPNNEDLSAEHKRCDEAEIKTPTRCVWY